VTKLEAFTLPASGGTVSFKYDPFGRRIYKSSTSATSVFAYDGDNLIEETNATGAVVARYEQSLNIDEPLAMLRSGTTSYYSADGLGSVTSLTNSARENAAAYTCDTFGNLTASTGSLINSFRYTGREFDTETSLYYYCAKYYDPSSGRFLSEDPIQFAGGSNFYAYTFDSPTNLKDPSGKIVWIPVIVGVGGAVMGGVGEGTKGYNCGDRGWKLTGDIGRGAASGAVGALTGLYVAVTTGNPWVEEPPEALQVTSAELEKTALSVACAALVRTSTKLAHPHPLHH
jgi:RHS repeat-associated protein